MAFRVAAEMGVHQNGLLIQTRLKGLNGNETKLKVAFPSNKPDVYGYISMILDVAYKWASKHHDTANGMSTTRNGIQHNSTLESYPATVAGRIVTVPVLGRS